MSAPGEHRPCNCGHDYCEHDAGQSCKHYGCCKTFDDAWAHRPAFCDSCSEPLGDEYCCPACGICHSDSCSVCDGWGLHKPWCPESEAAGEQTVCAGLRVRYSFAALASSPHFEGSEYHQRGTVLALRAGKAKVRWADGSECDVDPGMLQPTVTGGAS